MRASNYSHMAQIPERLGGPDVGYLQWLSGRQSRLAPRRWEVLNRTSVYTVARACMRYLLLIPRIGEVLIQAVFIVVLIGYSIQASS